jgi:hypothetical protein
MFRDFDRLRSTRRVELNAMTSPQFVSFVERKLRENGIAKIVPGEDLLSKAYIGMERGRCLEEAVAKLDDEDDTDDDEPPTDHERRVREMLEKRPALRWDAAVQALVDKRWRPPSRDHSGAGTNRSVGRANGCGFAKMQRTAADVGGQQKTVVRMQNHRAGGGIVDKARGKGRSWATSNDA